MARPTFSRRQPAERLAVSRLAEPDSEMAYVSSALASSASECFFVPFVSICIARAAAPGLLSDHDPLEKPSCTLTNGTSSFDTTISFRPFASVADSYFGEMATGTGGAAGA